MEYHFFSLCSHCIKFIFHFRTTEVFTINFSFLWYADVQQIDPLVHPFIVVEEGQTVEEAVREQSVPSDIDILEDLILDPGWEADQGNDNKEQDSDPDVREKEKQSSRLFLYQK